MHINVHHPTVSEVHTNTHDGGKFHVVQIADNSEGGLLKLFIRGDWSDWNQLVADVAAYRANQTDVSK
jgi:hypothetical protein